MNIVPYNNYLNLVNNVEFGSVFNYILDFFSSSYFYRTVIGWFSTFDSGTRTTVIEAWYGDDYDH